jgi:hypothetical protein
MIFYYTGNTATSRQKQGYDGNLPQQIRRRQAALIKRLKVLFQIGTAPYSYCILI